MKFSFIIPFKDRCYLCLRCIDSILELVYNNQAEIILIDDGSSYSNDLVKIYSLSEKYQNVTIIKNKISTGPGVSRNLGIDKAKGDFIVFVDSDDFIESSFFEKNNLNPNVDVYFTTTQTLNSNGIVGYYYKIDNDLVSSDDYIKHISSFHQFFAPVWGKIYNRDFLLKNKIRFNKEFRYYEDSYFNIMCIFEYRAHTKCISNGFYTYVLDNTDSISKKVNLKMLENCYQYIQYFLSIMHCDNTKLISDYLYNLLIILNNYGLYNENLNFFRSAYVEIRNKTNWTLKQKIKMLIRYYCSYIRRKK